MISFLTKNHKFFKFAMFGVRCDNNNLPDFRYLVYKHNLLKYVQYV